MRKLAARTMQDRQRKVFKQLEPFGVSRADVSYLVKIRRRMPREVKVRLGRMQLAGVPMRGLLKKLGLSNPKFEKLLEQHESGEAFSRKILPLEERETQVFDYLVGEGIPEKEAAEIARSKREYRFVLRDMLAKVTHLKELELDRKRYGVSRIPLKYWIEVIGLPKALFFRKLQKRVLEPLEDEHATKQLDKKFSEWKNISVAKNLRPATILDRYEAAISVGTNPLPRVINNLPAKRIRELSAQIPHSLDEKAVREAMKRAKHLVLSEVSFKAGTKLVDAMIARPGLMVHKKWARKELRKTFSQTAFENAINFLKEIGVLSMQGSYYRINTAFRTGTKGYKENRAKVYLRLWKLERAKRSKKW
jgi:hypothetical protein